MKEIYFPEINEMYQRIAAKLQQVNCLCNFFRSICPCMIICNFPTLSFCINLFSSSALPVTESSALLSFCINLFSSSTLPITVSSALIMHRHRRIGIETLFFTNILRQRINAIFNSHVCLLCFPA